MFFILLAGITVYSQTPKNPVGSWRIEKFQNRAETVIANLNTPATYEICRSNPAKPEFFDGQVHIVLEGSVFTDIDLDVDSCVVVKGKKIGLYADKFPRSVTHYHGTYKRLENATEWSESLNWSYNFIAGRTDRNNTFNVANNAEGLYRVCQTLLVLDGAPFPYDVGYFLYVDGMPVSSDTVGAKQIRFVPGNCVDVYGKLIFATVLGTEIDWTKNYKSDGKIQYILKN